MNIKAGTSSNIIATFSLNNVLGGGDFTRYD